MRDAVTTTSFANVLCAQDWRRAAPGPAGHRVPESPDAPLRLLVKSGRGRAPRVRDEAAARSLSPGAVETHHHHQQHHGGHGSHSTCLSPAPAGSSCASVGGRSASGAATTAVEDSSVSSLRRRGLLSSPPTVRRADGHGSRRPAAAVDHLRNASAGAVAQNHRVLAAIARDIQALDDEIATCEALGVGGPLSAAEPDASLNFAGDSASTVPDSSDASMATARAHPGPPARRAGGPSRATGASDDASVPSSVRWPGGKLRDGGGSGFVATDSDVARALQANSLSLSTVRTGTGHTTFGTGDGRSLGASLAEVGDADYGSSSGGGGAPQRRLSDARARTLQRAVMSQYSSVNLSASLSR